MLRGVGMVAAYVLGLILTSEAFLLLESRFQGIWLPLSLAVLLYFCLGLTSLTGGVKGSLAVMTGGGVLATWLATNESLPAGRVEKFAVPAALVVAVVGALWWLAACAKSKKKLPMLWMLLIACCAWLVGYFSGSTGGASHMWEFFMRRFHLSEESAHQVVFILRKSIHYTFYATVGFVSLMTARKSGGGSVALFGILVALTFASFDEYRQSFFPGRTASVYDVLLDMTGAATVVGLASLKKRPKPARA